MKKLGIVFIMFFLVFSCNDDNKQEEEIAKIDINFNVERFDRAFAKATPSDLPQLKKTFPFMFSKRINDSVWLQKMNDTLQQQLFEEIDKKFGNFSSEEEDIKALFQHIKYYDKTFTAPRVVTFSDYVKYRDKTIVTDTIALVALDTYLGEDHQFYGGIPQYISQNMKPSQIVSDLASDYSKKYIFQSQNKTLLDDMIYFGKQLYFKDKVIPSKSDAEKIGYTQEQLDWAVSNESYIWRFFVENELLYSTDTSLSNRFIAPAPFSKFYLELDSESPGRLGQYIGWQIVRAYMENNDVPLMNMLQEDAKVIFEKSKFKPRK